MRCVACFQTGIQSAERPLLQAPKGLAFGITEHLRKDCKSAWRTLGPASGTAPVSAAAGGAFSLMNVGQLTELLVWELVLRALSSGCGVASSHPANAGNEQCIAV